MVPSKRSVPAITCSHHVPCFQQTAPPTPFPTAHPVTLAQFCLIHSKFKCCMRLSATSFCNERRALDFGGHTQLPFSHPTDCETYAISNGTPHGCGRNNIDTYTGTNSTPHGRKFAHAPTHMASITRVAVGGGWGSHPRPVHNLNSLGPTHAPSSPSRWLPPRWMLPL